MKEDLTPEKQEFVWFCAREGLGIIIQRGPLGSPAYAHPVSKRAIKNVRVRVWNHTARRWYAPRLLTREECLRVATRKDVLWFRPVGLEVEGRNGK